MKAVTEDRELSELAEACAQGAWLAVDTEFMREKTYFPELCLLQLGMPGRIALVDPLASLSLAPLAAILADPKITKLLHAPRQDLEVLEPVFGRNIRPLFDTQLAAALCGAAPQASYSTVVQDFLGIDVGASHARTDWTRRPLRPEQLDYAAEDVRHLPALYEVLGERLNALGRMAWFEEDMRALETLPVTVQPGDAWKRIKGAAGQPPAARALLPALGAWREETAVQRNLPRQWLLNDRTLIEIARQRPVSLPALAAIDGLHPGALRRHGDALLACIADAPSAAAAPPVAEEPDRQLVKRLQAVVRSQAAALEIDPALLASRAELVELAVGGAPTRLSSGWRRALLGEQLAAIAAAG